MLRGHENPQSYEATKTHNPTMPGNHRVRRPRNHQATINKANVHNIMLRSHQYHIARQ